MSTSTQQEISAASDAGVRKYREDTAAEEITAAGIATAMHNASKEATDKLYKKLSKIVSVANPSLGDDWLKEVRSMNVSFHFTNDVCLNVLYFNKILIVFFTCSDRKALEFVCCSGANT